MSERVLVVDDDAGVRYTLREVLVREGLDVDEASGGEEALQKFDAHPAALVVTDLRMPGMDGMELLARLTSRTPAPKVVLITAHGSERQAVAAIKAGAWDYFRKPFENDEIVAVARRAIETMRLSAENERLTGELALAGSMVYASEPMRRLARLVARAAPLDVTVLIVGESGTGKERVAEALWRASRRANQAFLRFNCAALTPELAEAELFGHAKGAFTGAVRARSGLFREADQGTLLLDEVAELTPNAQAKLLRILQDGEVRPVGEDRTQKVDVRVLAATHRDLKERVAAGLFREDLFYRLNVVNLRVPPLRERVDDIPGLARHFLEVFAERFGVTKVPMSDNLQARLLAYGWPGNVRELEHAIENLVALSPDGTFDLTLLPGRNTAEANASPLGLRQRMEAYERGLVVDALRRSRENRSEAARLLGISRVSLHDKLKKYGITSSSSDEPEGPDRPES